MNPHLYLIGLQIAMESAQRLVADLASGAATPGDAEAEIRESILELARKAGITLTPHRSMNTTLEALEARRTELVDEKAAITQELAKLKPRIETTPPYLRGSAEYRDLLDRRSELTSDQADLEAEIQDVNSKIHKARAAAGSPAFHLGHVVSMVAARIAAGDSRPVADLAAEAKRDLEEIKLAISES